MTSSPDSPEIAEIHDLMSQRIFAAIQSYLDCFKEVFWTVNMGEADKQLLHQVAESWPTFLNAFRSLTQSGE